MKIFKFVFSPIDVNTYILADSSGDCAVIDCGCYDTREFEKMVRFIDSKKLKPVLLLNTHCHLDHVFGNGFFLERYMLATCCNKLDEINLESTVEHASYFGLRMQQPPVPGKYLNDNEIIAFGNEKLVAIHVPGHSPGSMAFYSEKNDCLFSGDALFAGSIGRSDLPGGDHQTLLKSIEERLFTLPGQTVVYPGHGQATTIEKEKTTNPFFRQNQDPVEK
jgi:glyoxylase-like metal-dependent hydrolase (beta-lactamase superfamily II)